MPANKATKKFKQSGKLKQTIQKRRERKKVLKVHERARAGKQARKLQRERQEMDAQAGVSAAEQAAQADEAALKSMDMDTFLRSFGSDESDGSGSDSELDHVDIDQAGGAAGATADSSDSSSDDDEAPSEQHEQHGMDDSASSGGESGDESEPDEETKAVLTGNKRMRDELEQHKQELAELKKNDPEFYQYLQQNDKTLLEFDADPSSSSESEAESEDDEDDGDAVQEDGDVGMDDRDNVGDATTADRDRIVVTKALVRELEQRAVVQNSYPALRKLVSVFRAAVHFGDEDSSAKSGKYQIASPGVYNGVMVLCVSKLHLALGQQLRFDDEDAAAGEDDDAEDADADADMGDGGDEQQQSRKRRQVHQHPRWGKLRPVVNNILRLLLHAMQELSQDSVLRFLLSTVGSYIRFLTPFPKLARSWLKTFLRIWSDSSKEDAEDPNIDRTVRALAYIRIRQMAVDLPFPCIEDCLKGVYLTYVRHSKFVNELTLPSIAWMATCVVDLYGVDPVSSYQHAFVYIRQLGISLRSATSAKSKDAVAKVTNWQYLHSLSIWVSVVTEFSSEEQLGALGYPVIQLLFGLARLVPTARYIPLRLHCVRLLQQMAAATRAYVPSAALLLDILESAELRKRTRPATDRPPLLHVLVKLPSNRITTRVTHDAIVSQTFKLLSREVELYRYNIGFPELATPIVLRLKSFAKSCSHTHWRNMARGVVDSITKRADWVKTQRATTSYSLRDAPKTLETLLPSGAPNALERLKASSPSVSAQAPSSNGGSAASGGQGRRQNDRQVEASKASESSDSEGDGSDSDSAEETNGQAAPAAKRARRIAADDEEDEDDVVEDLYLSD